MDEQKGLPTLLKIGIGLLIVGVFCFATYSAPTPETPYRVAYSTVTGTATFDHKLHASDAGIGLSCLDCHHTMEDEEEVPEACGECHLKGEGSEDMIKRADALHTQCIGCHKEFDVKPVDCNECHVKVQQ